jgi:hypothetical protein
VAVVALVGLVAVAQHQVVLVVLEQRIRVMRAVMVLLRGLVVVVLVAAAVLVLLVLL